MGLCAFGLDKVLLLGVSASLLEAVTGWTAVKWGYWGNEHRCTPQEILFLTLRQHINFDYIHIHIDIAFLYRGRIEISVDLCVDQISLESEEDEKNLLNCCFSAHYNAGILNVGMEACYVRAVSHIQYNTPECQQCSVKHSEGLKILFFLTVYNVHSSKIHFKLCFSNVIVGPYGS